MDMRVVIDQGTADAVYARDGAEGFDRWWDALGALVRLTWPNDPRHAGKRQAAGADQATGEV